MDISNENLEEVIKPEFIEQYTALHNDLWYRMVHVYTNIIILEKIEEFFHYVNYIYAPQENIFWYLTYHNFKFTTVLFIYALTKDEGKDVHTLKTFKRKLTEWIQDSKQEYKNSLESTDFDNKLKSIHKKITNFRNRIIAHRLLDGTTNLLSRADGIAIPELRQVYKDAERLFSICSVGSHYVTSLYLEGTCGGKPIEKDIDRLVDLIIKNSRWLNKPETYPFWNQIRQYRPKKDLEDLNRWRKKFGMPEV